MFVIVRHGNTFEADEPPRRIGARTDLPLTATGIAQAHALGAHFAALGWRFSRMLISPLARTRATAQAILARQAAGATAILPEPCAWLNEIDHGPDENRSEEAVLARIGMPALAAWDARAEPPPGWHVDGDTRRSAWRDLFDEAGAQSTLLVTSNGAARFALLADAALMAAAPALQSLKLPTGGYGVIRRGSGGALEVPIWGKRP